MTGKRKQISFGDDFGDVTVKANGVSIEIHADGSILAHTKAAVTIDVPANDREKASAPPRVGDKMPDGTIYAGVSPDTGRAMYAMPADATLTLSFNEAQKYAKDLDAHGHTDWRVPTKNELNVLFNKRVAIGAFNVTGSDPAGWYWTASEINLWNAWSQDFSDGDRYNSLKVHRSSLRCVR